MQPATPHFPHPVPIDAYGSGGFRFASMSHRGSLLCLPSGIWGWPVALPDAIDAGGLEPIFAEASDIDFLLIGTGAAHWRMPAALRGKLQALHISTDVLLTGPALRTYNIVLGERRRVAAALIAVE